MSWKELYFKSAEIVDADLEPVLAAVAVLKKLATDYYHPKVGFENVNAACVGRNYFNVFDSDGNIDDVELKRIFAEAAALELPADYHHP